MPSTILDSVVFRDIFTTPAMREVWSDESRVQKYLDFEGALARAQAKLKIIPKNAAAEIVKHCNAEQYDMAKLKTRPRRSVIRCCPSSSNWSSCAKAASANGRIGAPPRRTSPTPRRFCRSAIRSNSSKRRSTRFATRWRGSGEEISRHTDGGAQQFATGSADHLRLQDGDDASRVSSVTSERLRQMRPRLLVGEFGGAAGTLSSLGKQGLKCQAALMKELKLGQPEISWHTVRDRIAEVGCFLGLVTGSCGKIAFDVKLLMQTEVEEVYEPFHEGRGSSSTMPQKRNPISSVYITAQAADGEAARGGAVGSAGRGPRARDRAVGDRMDRAAGNLHAVGRRAGADALPHRRPAGQRKENEREYRHHQGPDHVGGGDDGAWADARPQPRARPSRTTSAAR